MATRTATAESDWRSAPAKVRRNAPPVLVRMLRNGVEESAHRGDIVEVDIGGRMLRALGDPDHVVNLRSAAKPFSLLALIEAGGVKEFELEPAELAIMTGSHSGEDLHVRTLQALYRRTGLTQAMLATGTEGMPLDALTAARLARDGERPGEIRHMCSGYHTAFLLLARMKGWPLEEYWLDDHPTQQAARDVIARSFGVPAAKLVTSLDGCGVPTFAFPLREIARAYAFLADPESVRSDDARAGLASSVAVVRNAMLSSPEMIGGTRDRLDTSVMKALPGRLVAKGGAEGLRCYAILPGPRAKGGSAASSGLALKVEDGGSAERATSAASVEALVQAGVIDGQAQRVLARYHRPTVADPHGRPAGESIAAFELAPVGELVG